MNALELASKIQVDSERLLIWEMSGKLGQSLPIVFQPIWTGSNGGTEGDHQVCGISRSKGLIDSLLAT